MGSPLQAIMSLLQGRPKQQIRLTSEGDLDLGRILAGSQIQPMQKSPYERTMRPGETRSAGDLQDMLAEVILAAGSAALPIGGQQGAARGMGGRRAPRPASKMSPEGRGQDMWMSSVVRRLQQEGLGFKEAVLKAHDLWNEQAQMEAEFLAQHGSE